VRIAATGSASSTGAQRKRLAVLDRAGTLPGRGAYLCRDRDAAAPLRPDAGCLARAIRRGGIARTLRAPVTLAPELVESVRR